MNSKPKKEIVILLSIALFAVVYLAFQNPQSIQMKDTFFGDINFDIPDTDFVKFALVVSFAYDMLPTIVQQFSISAITVQLLLSGFSPVLLTIISALGLLAGQMILYGFGMFVKKIHKGSIGNIAGGHHIFMKYHFLIYLIIPFVGILGDAGMIYSGHQRINPIRIIPFLFIANIGSTARWVIPTVAELKIGDSLQ